MPPPSPGVCCTPSCGPGRSSRPPTPTAHPCMYMSNLAVVRGPAKSLVSALAPTWGWPDATLAWRLRGDTGGEAAAAAAAAASSPLACFLLRGLPVRLACLARCRGDVGSSPLPHVAAVAPSSTTPPVLMQSFCVDFSSWRTIGTAPSLSESTTNTKRSGPSARAAMQEAVRTVHLGVGRHGRAWKPAGAIIKPLQCRLGVHVPVPSDTPHHSGCSAGSPSWCGCGGGSRGSATRPSLAAPAAAAGRWRASRRAVDVLRRARSCARTGFTAPATRLAIVRVGGGAARRATHLFAVSDASLCRCGDPSGQLALPLTPTDIPRQRPADHAEQQHGCRQNLGSCRADGQPHLSHEQNMEWLTIE